MIPPKPRTPKCSACGASLGGARLVVAGHWRCPRCEYQHEIGHEVEPIRRLPKTPASGLRLFDIEQYTRRPEDDAA